MNNKKVKGGREIIKEIESIEAGRPANVEERKNKLIKYRKIIAKRGAQKYKDIKGGGSWKVKLGKAIGVSDSTITDLLRPDVPGRKNEDIVISLEKQLGLEDGLLTKVRDGCLGGSWVFIGYDNSCSEDQYWSERELYFNKLRKFFKENDLESCFLLVKEMSAYLKLPIEIQKKILEYKDKITLCDNIMEERKTLEYKEQDKYEFILEIEAIEKLYPINYDADALEQFFEFIMVDRKSVLPIYTSFKKIKNKNTYDKDLLRELTKYSI